MHDTQPPLQATLQHTPSAQKLEAQSSLLAHGEPVIFLPQLPLVHAWPGAHWLFCVQLWKHAPAVLSQAYGAQMAVGLCLQAPRPLQM